jgi:hypothetical protein
MWLAAGICLGLILLGKYGPVRVLRPLLQGFWYLVKGALWLLGGLVLFAVVLQVLLSVFAR